MRVNRRPRADRRRQEGGAVAIMVALMSTMLIGIMAFVTDFGMAYANKAAVQNGADAAALAVARQVTTTASPTINCTGLALASAADPSLRTLAEQYFAENTPRGGSLAAGTAGLSFSCTSTGFTVSVTGTQDSPTFFGQIYGASKIPINQSAKAVVGPAVSVTGLRPFAVCQADANLMKAATLNFTISFDNSDAGCGYAPGNWGVLDFNGGSNGTGEVADWILNGYSGSVSVATPSYIYGNPGAPNPGALESEMDLHPGDRHHAASVRCRERKREQHPVPHHRLRHGDDVWMEVQQQARRSSLFHCGRQPGPEGLHAGEVQELHPHR